MCLTLPATQAHALALLPERQAHYDACCQTLARLVAASQFRHVLGAQQTVGWALGALNSTRTAAGLSLLAGPRRYSLDELLHLQEAPAQTVKGGQQDA